ncbi:hypothetical protein DFH09DRAFT_1183635 [Mycena vulgaris]|nr:hypothetical protein DFH09DRAFT_1183635 [Mycena vulgaris]
MASTAPCFGTAARTGLCSFSGRGTSQRFVYLPNSHPNVSGHHRRRKSTKTNPSAHPLRKIPEDDSASSPTKSDGDSVERSVSEAIRKPDRLVNDMLDMFAPPESRPRDPRENKLAHIMATTDTLTNLWSAGQNTRRPRHELLAAENWSLALKRQNRKTDLVRSADAPNRDRPPHLDASRRPRAPKPEDEDVQFIRDPLPHFDSASPRKSRKWIEQHMPRHLKDALNDHDVKKSRTVDESIATVMDAIIPRNPPGSK